MCLHYGQTLNRACPKTEDLGKPQYAIYCIFIPFRLQESPVNRDFLHIHAKNPQIHQALRGIVGGGTPGAADKARPYVGYRWINGVKIREKNARLPAECGRGRWKIENEHNNLLKNRGYNPEHNFGRGKNHAYEIYAALNLPVFLPHGLLLPMEKNIKRPGRHLGDGRCFSRLYGFRSAAFRIKAGKTF
jgi:hypothetical protein